MRSLRTAGALATGWLESVTANPEHTHDQLAQPVAGRLFFAGEATHRQGFGTVHGACLSGQRAARPVI